MKKAIALLLAIATILTLSACNKTKDENSSDTSLPTQSVTDKAEEPDSTDKETKISSGTEEETKQPTDSNTPNAGNKNQTTKPSENKPQTGNSGGSTGTTEGNKKPDTGNNDTKKNEFVTYQGAIFHDMHTGYLIGDYISLSLKETGNNSYEAVYMQQYGGGIPQIIPDRVATSIFFSKKFPKEYQKDLLEYIYNAMPSVDQVSFDKLFTSEYSKYFYKCTYNGELYLSVVEFENFPKFGFTSASTDKNGNLKFTDDIWILGDGVDKNDSCAINIQNFKLSTDKNTITATAKGAKYNTSVTLFKTNGAKWGTWGGSDLTDMSAEEFAKMVTVVK